MGNKDSNYDQVMNLVVGHDVLFRWSVGLNGLLAVVEDLRLESSRRDKCLRPRGGLAERAVCFRKICT